MSRESFARRSFVYRRLQEAGFTFADSGDAALAERPTPSDARLKLIDLSVLPRWGLKGRGVAAWLARMAQPARQRTARSCKPMER
jgi:hypothetical protein